MNRAESCIIARQKIHAAFQVFRRSAIGLCAVLTIAFCCTGSLRAQAKANPQGNKNGRAQRPDWSNINEPDIFFDDAFQTLDGPRPDHLMPHRSRAVSRPNVASPAKSNVPANEGWSNQIRAETLESQIKRRILLLQTSVKSPARFAGGEFKNAKQQFEQLATLFRIVEEFDATIRWNKQAATASVRCAIGAMACEKSDRDAFQEASSRRDDLMQLLRGARLPQLADEQQNNDRLSWDKVADRRSWMRWIAVSEQRLRTNVSEVRTKPNPAMLDAISSDAQMLSTLARVLSHDEMEDGADADYRDLCRQLGTAAEALDAAIEQQDTNGAATAIKAIGRSCIQCHESYKG